MKNSLTKRITALVTVICLFVVACSLNVFAAVTKPGLVTDVQERANYLDIFNNGVNAVKEDMPYLLFTKQTTIISRDIEDEQADWLSILFNAIFVENESLISGIFAKLTEENTSGLRVQEVYKSFSRDNILPVSGESYVSALTTDYEFDLQAQTTEDASGEKLEILITFPDGYTPANVDESGLDKVFDIASGSINPTIFGVADGENGMLEDVKFSEFSYDDASIYTVFDEDGTIQSYKSSMTYNFSISFYDFMQILTFVTGTDFLSLAVQLANKILEIKGDDPIDAENVLSEKTLRIGYRIDITMDKFDWSPRYFGDIDNNGEVDAYDARAALRHAVELELIEDSQNLLYADVNFDGKVNAADARIILRTAVSLETKFDYPPDGCEITIVDVSDKKPELEEDFSDATVDEEENDNNGENTENDTNGDTDTDADTDATTNVTPEQVVGSIGALIDGIYSTAISGTDAIYAIVDAFQGALNT